MANARKWVADPKDGTLSMYLYPYAGIPAWEVVPEPNDGLDRWNSSTKSFIRNIDPMAAITGAIKALPVAKRTDPDWGSFINQCQTALEHQDIESFSYLVNNALSPIAGYKGYVPTDTDFIKLLSQAKQLFGI